MLMPSWLSILSSLGGAANSSQSTLEERITFYWSYIPTTPFPSEHRVLIMSHSISFRRSSASFVRCLPHDERRGRWKQKIRADGDDWGRDKLHQSLVARGVRNPTVIGEVGGLVGRVVDNVIEEVGGPVGEVRWLCSRRSGRTGARGLLTM